MLLSNDKKFNLSNKNSGYITNSSINEKKKKKQLLKQTFMKNKAKKYMMIYNISYNNLIKEMMFLKHLLKIEIIFVNKDKLYNYQKKREICVHLIISLNNLYIYQRIKQIAVIILIKWARKNDYHPMKSSNINYKKISLINLMKCCNSPKKKNKG